MCARATASGCTSTAATARPQCSPSEYRAQLAAIGRADSVGIDAHKWMYVPVDAGIVLIRDAKLMRDTFSLVPPYLRSDDDQHGVQGPPWLSEYGSEQTRPFRALKVWMALRYFGTSGYARLIAHDIAMARRLADRVRATPELELREPQGLSIVCFRAVPAALAGDDAASTRSTNACSRRCSSEERPSSRAPCSAGAAGCARASSNPGTTPDDIDAVFDAVLAKCGATCRAGTSCVDCSNAIVAGTEASISESGSAPLAETPRAPPATAEQLIESLLLEANGIVIHLDRRPDQRGAEARGVEALAIGNDDADAVDVLAAVLVVARMRGREVAPRRT